MKQACYNPICYSITWPFGKRIEVVRWQVHVAVIAINIDSNVYVGIIYALSCVNTLIVCCKHDTNVYAFLLMDLSNVIPTCSIAVNKTDIS